MPQDARGVNDGGTQDHPLATSNGPENGLGGYVAYGQPIAVVATLATVHVVRVYGARSWAVSRTLPSLLRITGATTTVSPSQQRSSG